MVLYFKDYRGRSISTCPLLTAMPLSLRTGCFEHPEAPVRTRPAVQWAHS